MPNTEYGPKLNQRLQSNRYSLQFLLWNLEVVIANKTGDIKFTEFLVTSGIEEQITRTLPPLETIRNIRKKVEELTSGK